MIILFFSSMMKDWGHLHYIRSLYGCTSVRSVSSRSSRRYLYLSNNNTHHCIRCQYICKMSTRSNLYHINYTIWISHVHQSKSNTDNDMYIVIFDSESRIYIYQKNGSVQKNGRYSSAIDQNDTKWCWHTNRYKARYQKTTETLALSCALSRGRCSWRRRRRHLWSRRRSSTSRLSRVL
jgi:hypothetical protein